MDENTIICRCSDVTLKEIRELISQGYQTFDEIKRITRAGMGPCQGKTCGYLIMREIANATGKNMQDIKFQTNRPPVVGVKLGLIAEEGRNEE
ncbi:MAG TPA: (2Fe-2S)-binding protein [Sedimentibacter sp.]|jgi:bacterioferritin-associated ferredoxin|nr:(2Fe-2S)-binding protein [Sedimentibacter sp.]HHY99761.1 (2Fe-2S)-binding protein [Tissierellia bacterium]HOK49210.1 (2Fe-2S)-binding protein [Sedimentibacter sp.]HOW23451.1 (2Fe-2S)-binding protein [Sedimentibacter sp.]HRC80322.1 (2Fe-2S)-binding protein [Sedimentibacter sp.]